ncbi:TonB-dependent receptor [Glacieibacterium sp.]|uniref:TonB-dependent receptor n=1 Tax=Glacieibacterium sp. TaxID=2860237 RepID=UPI003B00BC8A
MIISSCRALDNAVRRVRFGSALTGASSLLALVAANAAYAQSTPGQPSSSTTLQATSDPALSSTPQRAADQPPPTSQQAETAAAASRTSPGAPDAGANGDEIVVTGLIGSLVRNLDLKRQSAGVVDVISAEDIGKFPDANVASALQRLPGVTIQRSGSRGDATGVSIRGFGGGFVDTLYDGRHISTATGNRGVDFTTVGSDFVGRLSVLKTPDVALSTSAIGGTVDIAFPKPFDREGFHVAATASGTMQSRNKNVRPTGGLLVSDTFADGKFGILADIAYSRRDTTTNNAGTNGWVGITLYPCQRTASCAVSDFTPANKETKPAWFPQRILAAQENNLDERVDGRLALQWRPTDTILFTLDDNFSRQNLRTNNGQTAAWFNGTDLRNVKTDANGTIVDFNQFGTPNDLIAIRTRNVLRTNQTGLNMKWEIVEHLTLDLDGAYSKSVKNPGHLQVNDQAFLGYGGFNPDPNGTFITPPCVFPAGATSTTPPTSCIKASTILGANTGVTILGNSNKYIPSIHDFGPRGNAADFGSQTLAGSHVQFRGGDYNTDVVKQARGSLNWDKDDLKVTFGGQYVEDRLHTETTNTSLNGASVAYSGYGPQSGRVGLSQATPDTFLPYVSTENFFPGYTGNIVPAIPRFDPYKVYAQIEAAFPNGPKIVPMLDPGTVLEVRERVLGIFFKAAFENEIAGMPFRVSAGVRRESTSVRTMALGRILLGLYRPPGDPTLIAPDPSLGPNGNGYSNPQPIIGKNKYSFLLPSVDLKLDVTSNLVVRADASRTLTRPALADLRPTVVPSTLRVGTLAATGGNTDLSPYLSDNYDLGVEWYYHRNSYFAVNGFVKNISNFIVGGVQSQTINNVIDPSTGQIAKFNVQLRVNGPNATVKGVEIAWQQIFGSSGFGFQANATIPSTNRKFDSANITGTGFSVPGLAKSANFVGFYDKHGFQIRAAVNWRDQYLLQLGQGSTGAFGAEPVYVNRQLQVDASTSWDINEHVTLFGEATNINNSTYSTHGRFNNQLLDVWSYGRRYTAGARFHF